MKFKLWIIVGFLIARTASEVSAASPSAPIQYQPDPSLRIASLAELEDRIGKGCMQVQANLQRAPAASFTSSCGCYASRFMRSLEEAEMKAFRETGLFVSSALGKGRAAVDACRLKQMY